MYRSRSLYLILISIVVTTGIVGGLAGTVASDNRSSTGQAPPINETTTAEIITHSQGEVSETYAVTANSADEVDITQLAEYGKVGTRADARTELTMSPSNATVVRNISWVENVHPVTRFTPAEIPGSSDGVNTDNPLGIERIHQNGITGEGVGVGVIDTGFDTDNSAIASNVVDTESFRTTPGSPNHGTSVAEIVTRTAPDSQLYLASISSATDTEEAIDYLTNQNVDIIILSGGFYIFEDNGEHPLTDEINSATENGVLYINSAGNEAQVHWEGDFRDTDEDDMHEWIGSESGDELNCLSDCNTAYSGDLTVYVRWDDTVSESSYQPSLYNQNKEQYIAIGDDDIRTTPSGTKYAKLTVEDIPSQEIALSINHVDGPADDTIEVIVAPGPQEIQYNVPSSSIIAPADVPAALTVAAYERDRNRLAPYSSRGPTDDERRGVDVTAYTNIEITNGFYNSGIFGGTSAAAPYAGGVGALVEASQPSDQSSSELTNLLKSSSDDILDSGADAASGSGVINAITAVNTVETPSPTPTPDPPQNDPSNSTESANTTSNTTVTVQLNSAPDGLQQYNISVKGPSESSITSIKPGVISGNSFEIVSGGKETSTVTARGVDLAGVVGQSSESVRLYEIELTGDISRSELTVSATDLTSDNSTAIDRSLLRLDITRQSQTNPFSDGIPGVGSAPPTDTDDDGKLEDIDGDGEKTFEDAIALAFADTSGFTTQQRVAVDFDGDGNVDFNDAIELAFE